jgi:hypothetical protein
MIKNMKAYRLILKEEGWQGLLQKVGWKVVLLVVVFFCIKGTISLLIILGGVELIRNAFGG